MTKETKKKTYIYTIGRRKRSTARIRLFSGKGQIIVNDKPADEYFKSVSEVYFLRPFAVTQTSGKYFVTARILGGGTKGQADAFVHGVSRALVKVEEGKYKNALKRAGFLTRDPRERERRKPGLAQGARAAKQSPKR